MTTLEQTLRVYLPVRLLKFLYFHLCYPKAKAKERKEVLSWLTSAEGRNYWTEHGGEGDIESVVSYLKKHPINIFPYRFRLKHNELPILKQTFFDSEAERFYVLHKNHKIYMKKGWSKEQAAGYLNGLLVEQDEASPHCYRLDELDLTGEDVLVDAGAAEGIVAVELLERVKRIYVFDMDPEWLECLKLTFADTDKVVIVPKGLGAKTEGDITTLDEYFKGERVDLIKADIEGAECDMVRGGQNTLRGAKKAIICTYHRENDAQDLTQAFAGMGFETQFSKGYMIFGDVKELKPPYLRHGVLFATKE